MQFRNPPNPKKYSGVNSNDPRQSVDGYQNQPTHSQPPGPPRTNNYPNMPMPTQRPVQPTGQNYPQSTAPQYNQPNQQPQTQNQPNPYQRPTQSPTPQQDHTNLPTPTPVNAGLSYDASQPSTHKSKSKREELRNTIYTIALFILAPLFAVFMIVFVFQSYVVDGTSMDPTLQNNDRVFILKLPKSLAKISGNEFIPARNEIIVFKKPGIEETQLIKRVIGLPGDKVIIENGVLTVYNIDNPAGFNPDAGTNYIDSLATYDPDSPKIEANVGEGELFVLGDNRTPGGSLDSHSGLGLVPVENVVGRLWVRYFPLSSFEVYANLINLRTNLALSN